MALETVSIKDSGGSAVKISADLHSTDNYAQVVKMGFGADGDAPTLVSSAAPLPISPPPIISVSGVIDGENDYVELALPAGYQSLYATCTTDNFAGAIAIQISLDGTNFSYLYPGYIGGAGNPVLFYGGDTITGIPTYGALKVRAIAIGYEGGISTVTLSASSTPPNPSQWESAPLYVKDLVLDGIISSGNVPVVTYPQEDIADGIYIGDIKFGEALPAGTNLIGKVSAGCDGSTIYNGTTALTPKRAAISCSSSGANAIVSAVTGKKIRVLQCKFSASGTVNAKFQSASTDLEGLAYEIASSGYVLPFSPIGWFETAAGEALNLNLSAAIAVGGVLAYIEV